MKITTLLSYASALALAVLIAGLFVAPEPMLSVGAFTALLASLMVVRDYTPRNYFVVTGSAVSRPSSRSGLDLPRAATPRRRTQRPVALVS